MSGTVADRLVVVGQRYFLLQPYLYQSAVSLYPRELGGENVDDREFPFGIAEGIQVEVLGSNQARRLGDTDLAAIFCQVGPGGGNLLRDTVAGSIGGVLLAA